MSAPGVVLLLMLLGELPLPDTTLYGTIVSEEGLPVVSGALRARIRRGQNVVLEVPGQFHEDGGTFWYVLNVPLETAIGAPGPSGAGAHEGDVIDAVLLDGQVLRPRKEKKELPVLAAGAVARVDLIGGKGGLVYFRGDCSPDLTLNITDGVRVLGYLFLGAQRPPCLEACDGDGSGDLNISDGVFIFSYLFLGGRVPPPPGPACGVDPSPSALGCVQSLCTP
jgi:hypothetical protein